MLCHSHAGRLSTLALLSLLTLAGCDQRRRLEAETAALREQLARDEKELHELHAKVISLNPPGQLRQAGPAELHRAKTLITSLVRDKERLEQDGRDEQARHQALQAQLEDYQNLLNRRAP
jgi:chromosome segregation ATPase